MYLRVRHEGLVGSQSHWLVSQMILVEIEMDEEEMTLSALLCCSLVPITMAAVVSV